MFRAILVSILLLTGCNIQQYRNQKNYRRIDKAVLHFGDPRIVVGYIYTKYSGFAPDSHVIIKSDAVHRTVSDTFYLSEYKHDTIVRYIEKNNVKIRYVQNKDTVFLSVECKDSIIYKERVIQLQNSIEAYKKQLENEKRQQRNYLIKSVIVYLLLSIIIALLLVTLARIFL